MSVLGRGGVRHGTPDVDLCVSSAARCGDCWHDATRLSSHELLCGSPGLFGRQDPPGSEHEHPAPQNTRAAHGVLLCQTDACMCTDGYVHTVLCDVWVFFPPFSVTTCHHVDMICHILPSQISESRPELNSVRSKMWPISLKATTL